MEKQLFDFATWIIRQLLQQAIEKPEKRREVIALAKKMVKEVSDLLAALEIA